MLSENIVAYLESLNLGKRSQRAGMRSDSGCAPSVCSN